MTVRMLGLATSPRERARISIAVQAVAALLGLDAEVKDVTPDERRSAILTGADDGPVAVGYDGTTAVRLLAAAAPRPVLLVPLRRGTRLSSTVERILLPLDGSAVSARTVAGVAARCTATGVDIVVTHVFDPRTAPAFWDQPAYASTSWGSEFLARFCNEPLARIELRSGDTGAQIAAAAEDEHVDLIALSWSQDATAGHAATLRRVLAGASAPVLLLPVSRTIEPVPMPAAVAAELPR